MYWAAERPVEWKANIGSLSITNTDATGRPLTAGLVNAQAHDTPAMPPPMIMTSTADGRSDIHLLAGRGRLNLRS
jgi:hypothetical protein